MPVTVNKPRPRASITETARRSFRHHSAPAKAMAVPAAARPKVSGFFKNKGGTSPMRTLRSNPPPAPVTKARTNMPNQSIAFSRAASAPDTQNTKVPTASQMWITAAMLTGRATETQPMLAGSPKT